MFGFIHCCPKLTHLWTEAMNSVGFLLLRQLRGFRLVFHRLRRCQFRGNTPNSNPFSQAKAKAVMGRDPGVLPGSVYLPHRQREWRATFLIVVEQAVRLRPIMR